LKDEDPIRAFFAIDLDDAAREAVCDVLHVLRESPGSEGVRWVRREALHVTLRFLGNIDPEQVVALAHAVGAEVAGQVPFAMTLGAVRLFPSPRRPRVVALEMAPEAELFELAAAVERGTGACGFEPEDRRFRAHLTLGRIKKGRGPATQGLCVPDGTATPVEDVVLFRSELQRSGAKYSPLERMALGGNVHP
jgi:2'-5' RNA ligase